MDMQISRMFCGNGFGAALSCSSMTSTVSGLAVGRCDMLHIGSAPRRSISHREVTAYSLGELHPLPVIDWLATKDRAWFSVSPGPGEHGISQEQDIKMHDRPRSLLAR